MKISFIKSREKKRIVEELNNQFGVEEVPYLLIESGKEKIRAFSGHLSKDEINEIASVANIDLMGLYFIKREHDLRLNMDATHLLSSQIKKNILEINDEQFYEWIRGRDLNVKVDRGTYVIKYKSDFLGCGKSNGEKIFNYVPKDRRIRRN